MKKGGFDFLHSGMFAVVLATFAGVGVSATPCEDAKYGEVNKCVELKDELNKRISDCLQQKDSPKCDQRVNDYSQMVDLADRAREKCLHNPNKNWQDANLQNIKEKLQRDKCL